MSGHIFATKACIDNSEKKLVRQQYLPHRGIKLLEHDMKVVEKIFEHRIWHQIEVDDMQFEFTKGKQYNNNTNNIIIIIIIRKFITNTCSQALSMNQISSVILHIYKGKGDPMECEIL